MLSLSYGDFDQTYGSGFRVLYDRGQYFEGAVLIGDYLKAHRELTIGQQKFLSQHRNASRRLESAPCHGREVGEGVWFPPYGNANQRSNSVCLA